MKRRRLASHAIFSFAAFSSSCVPPGPRRETPAVTADLAPTVRAVGCIGLTVANADRSAAFFENVLGFTSAPTEVVEGPQHARLEGIPGARTKRVRVNLGAECLELSQPLGGIRRLMPGDTRDNDLWFQHVAIVVRDIDAAYSMLEAAHVAHLSVAPQTLPAWNPAAGGIRAYYFKDPDAHALEIIWFPPGKGRSRWHADAGSAIFLGIDHTAIAVEDTMTSVRFYQHLGFHVVATSENWGPEQERLNAVPGAHLRITSLRVDAGPGVELLEYLAPRGGRAAPADERGDDIAHWRTALLADGARVPTALRDPDGHSLEIHAP